MLERINDLSPGVIGLRAVGKVSKEDYEQVLEPILDDARREGRRIRFLYQFGPEFEGFTKALGGQPRAEASNNWVVGGYRTESGKPILANDPNATA